MSPNVLRQNLRFSTIPCLLTLLTLTGCTHSIGTPTQTPATAQNWQFEIGSSIGPFTNQRLFISGELTFSGSSVTGLFNTHGLCLVSPQPFQYTGTYDASARALALYASNDTMLANMTLASPATSPSTGTMSGFGQVCALALGPTPAVGIEVPSLTGTFTGPLTGSANANATLTLAQSIDPNSQAAFPLTGSLQLTSGTCSSTIPISGTIQGVSFSLAATGSNSSGLTLSGVDASGGSPLTSVQLAFTSDPCNPGSASSYTGTLTLQ